MQSDPLGERRRPTDEELEAESIITPEDIDTAVRAFNEHAPPEARGLLDAEPSDRSDRRRRSRSGSRTREKNVKRPVASEARYRATMAKADEVDPRGRLACVLALARYTGRRLNALCSLLASDVLLSEQAVTRALAAAGVDPEIARHMPNGAIRFRGELDKQGYEDVAPLSTGARKALDLYLRTHPRVGDVPMFPKTTRPGEPMRKMDLSWLLRRAEDRANLPHLERGGFHCYRRLYAVERKHLPDVDVARSAGWRDIQTMKKSYQQADPLTTLQAVENAAGTAEAAEGGHNAGTVSDASRDASTA